MPVASQMHLGILDTQSRNIGVSHLLLHIPPTDTDDVASADSDEHPNKPKVAEATIAVSMDNCFIFPPKKEKTFVKTI